MASLLKDKLSRSPRNSIDSSAPDDQEADKYRLLVTAGPSYSTATHKIVHVNTSTPTTITNDFLTASIKVRIRNYRGLPNHSPSTSAYFNDAAHAKDQYSIAFSFVPKVDLPAVDTVWGNDFDHPVRERLPPGFNTAFKIVKEFIDPGLECDAYADEPWLYGPSLSCWFALGVGDKKEENGERRLGEEKQEEGDVLREGADSEEGWEIRRSLSIPENSEKRRKHFLSAANREGFTFEKGRTYHGDFYNPYLDFGNFALKLPGFSIRVIKYIDEKSHRLRYVFKNRKTGDVYFCVNLNLLWGDELKTALEDEQKEVEKFAGAEKERKKENEGQVNGNVAGESKAGQVRRGEQKPAQEPSTRVNGDGQATRSDGASGSQQRTEVKPTEAKPATIADGEGDTARSTGTSGSQKPAEVEPGLRDKPPALVEEVKKMSIQDTLQGTASAQKGGGRTGVLDDDVD